ncbi:conserved unknown protein [Ectocarpus siliculosus]|uniref:Ketoreductase domain-containing protein n=1 Tax=Ectocarpus siliculosus TaxID=2880 RepID=D8LTE4_ECTSI|nr:conserved unknown protein [Ectocarpus siliculosus]|eukprot:CBN78054.1 conserved unknown protein [Ectocarpus siliculosus]
MSAPTDPLAFPASAGPTAQKDAPPLSVPTFDVTGKMFVVTGGTQGMGLVISACIAKAGASAVTISARSQDTGEKAVAQLTEHTPSCRFFFVPADVAKEEDCSRLVSEADRLMGCIDGLVNCAAWTARATLDTTTVDVWDRMMNTNVRGPFLLVQAVSKSMRSKGRPGSIVNISSVVAHGGIPKVSTYSVSKAALNACTKMHAYELKRSRIRVNAINVGWTLTDNEHVLQRVEMGSENWIEDADKGHAMGRLLRPVDIAATVGHLLSDASAMMTGTIVDLHPEMVDNCWG